MLGLGNTQKQCPPIHGISRVGDFWFVEHHTISSTSRGPDQVTEDGFVLIIIKSFLSNRQFVPNKTSPLLHLRMER